MSASSDCKRLRGWSLQKETKAPDAPSFASASKLASKLLCLWAHGTLSATLIQELAHLALLDGAAGDELAALAKAGNYGEIKGNVHRDVVSTFCKGIHIEPFQITTSCIDPKTSQESDTLAAMFLPHVLFSRLETEYPDKFKDLFSVDKLEEFWVGAEKTGDDRLVDHPMKTFPNWRNKTVPLFVHGDGVEFQSRDSLMVWSFGSMLSLFGSLDNHFLAAVFPKSCTSSTTWDNIWKWLAWSFTALLQGKHPEVDPDGLPFRPGSQFDLAKGKPLTSTLVKGVIWSIQGDHEFFSNTLKLPHWRNHMPCWECDCVASNDNPAKCFKTIRPSLQAFVSIDHKEALEKAISKHPIFDIPGVSTRLVRGDGLHIMFTKGLYAHLCGSILHYLCWKNGPGVHQTVQPCQRLALIFDEIQKAYKANDAPTRLSNLKMSMFTNPKTPHASHPFLNAKGGECKHLGPALLQVCKAVLDPGVEVDTWIVQSLASICELVSLLDKAGMYLSGTEYTEALKHAESFLDHYDALNKWALEKGRLLFHVVTKFHTFLHLIENARFLNPRFHWCFKSEDFVGKVAKVGHSVSMGTKSTKLSLKVTQKYVFLLHLRLTRDGFGFLAQETEV